MRIRMVAAAHPSHPLHHLGHALSQADLAQYRHLIIRDSGKNRKHNDAWLGEQRWTVSHKATSIQAACMGLGYAWFAEGTIAKELADGRLKLLPLVAGDQRFYELYLILADRQAAGPGVQHLAQALMQAAKSAH